MANPPRVIVVGGGRMGLPLACVLADNGAQVTVCDVRPELVDDINAYLAERNANPQPYKWTAKGEAILEKIHRARAALDKAEAA